MSSSYISLFIKKIDLIKYPLCYIKLKFKRYKRNFRAIKFDIRYNFFYRNTINLMYVLSMHRKVKESIQNEGNFFVVLVHTMWRSRKFESDPVFQAKIFAIYVINALLIA